MSYHSDHGRKADNAHKRSPYPRAARHGKHTEIQGFPNTRGLGAGRMVKKPSPV